MEAIKEQLSNTVQAVLDGNFSSLEAWIELQELSKHLAKCIAEIEGGALIEANKNKGQGFKNWKLIDIKNNGSTYKFDHSESWRVINAMQKNIEEKMKQAAKLGVTVLDEDTGEVFEPAISKAKKESIIYK